VDRHAPNVVAHELDLTYVNPDPHLETVLSRKPAGVRALEPELVWLAHEHEPWRPRTM
jgi:hypothetical protein